MKVIETPNEAFTLALLTEKNLPKLLLRRSTCTVYPKNTDEARKQQQQ